jgi:A/G-specific adenine glycosylase
VIPYWERFLERFPDTAALANSAEEDVLALWSGLGYYRRAQALRRGAIEVTKRHGGRVPSDLDALVDLPGIGRYTAGAIASVAYGREAPVVDGNIKRVFSRLFAIRGGPAAERAYWSIAGALVRGPRPGDLNQAVMELGATVCTPRSPRCDTCPLARWCRALAVGRPTAFPSRRKSPPVRIVSVAVAWIERDGRVLLERRQPGGPLRGTWDLPAAVRDDGESSGQALVRTLATRHGLRVRAGPVVLTSTHSILASRLRIEVVGAAPLAPVGRRGTLRWAALSSLDQVAISSATGKIVRAVAVQRRSQDRLSSSSSSSSSGSRGRAKA